MPSLHNYSLRSNNGFTIWLPPNFQGEALNNLHVPTGAELWTEESSKSYPFGTKLSADDRVWRYCYSTDGCEKIMRGAMNNNLHMEGAAIGNAVEGAYTINWRIADTDYPTQVTYTAKDTYEGGYLWIQHAATYYPLYKIVKNAVATGAATATDYVILTLESPLLTDQATPWSTAYRNIYSDVKHDSPNWPSATSAIVCVPLIPITATYYFWGQTWGPVWIVGATGSYGNTANERDMNFTVDGDIIPAHTSTYESYQRAGFLLSHNLLTNDQIMMLQLAP